MPFVFSFSEEKKKLVEKVTWGVFPNTFSCQHGAVDLDYIPFVSTLDFMFFFFFFLRPKHHPCFDLKQRSGLKNNNFCLSMT